MFSFTPEEIAGAKSSAPKVITDFLASADFKKEIFAISKQHTLNLQGIAELSDIVTYMLLGLIPQHEFAGYIHSSHMHLSPEGQRMLLSEVDAKIFSEIKRRLQSDTTPRTEQE
ncbi:hypothetical protein K2P56_04015 [Patescibacteria group bacterium]|nr:hypothetical protein [Patescibacteria group bacterium]